MPSLWITANESLASVRSERVTIRPTSPCSDISSERTIPLIDVDLVVFSHGSQFTSSLVHALLERDIPILVLNSIGHVSGHFFPKIPPRGITHIEQYKRSLDPEFHFTIAAPLVAAKIYNQKRCIQRISKNRQTTQDHTGLYLRQRSAINKLADSTLTPDQIMGIEGASTAEYYRVWSSYLPEEFPFDKRSRRPPLNPVNACISFISTILYHEIIAACFATGLDPSLGHLHTTSNDRWSLALDLMEPFRPILVESLTLDLFSRAMLNSSHFTTTEDGGIYLNHIGRKTLILQYEKRLERYFHSDHLEMRTSLRQCVRNSAMQYKICLLKGTELTPFRMS